jgi:3-hydroxybutyryl-CoA dehydrogenase
MDEFGQIAVIGAGTMGHGIAQVFAMSGREVRLADRTVELAERGKQMIASNLEVVVDEGFLPAGEVEAVLARIRPVAELRQAVAAAEFVLEAVFEDLAVKTETWRLLDEYASGDALLASNTSSFDINELAALVTRRPERVIGTHWYNPPQIVPCVEVIPADVTSAETLEATVAFLGEIGKEPAVTKSVPGFVGNRIQLVMAAEAYRCVEQGIASAEDVDRIVRSSFGFRLGAYGPLQTADLAGLDTYLAVYEYLSERCGDPWYGAPELLRNLVGQGRIGVKALAGVWQYTEDEAKRLRAERDRILYGRLRTYLGGEGPRADSDT